MFCIKCGKEIANEMVFCPYCGEKVPTIKEKGTKFEEENVTNKEETDVNKHEESVPKEINNVSSNTIPDVEEPINVKTYSEESETNKETQLNEENKPSIVRKYFKLLGFILTIVVVFVGLESGVIPNPIDHIKSKGVSSHVMERYDTNRTVGKTLDLFFGYFDNSTVWSSYEEKGKTYVVASGVCESYGEKVTMNITFEEPNDGMLHVVSIEMAGIPVPVEYTLDTIYELTTDESLEKYKNSDVNSETTSNVTTENIVSSQDTAAQSQNNKHFFTGTWTQSHLDNIADKDKPTIKVDVENGTCEIRINIMDSNNTMIPLNGECWVETVGNVKYLMCESYDIRMYSEYGTIRGFQLSEYGDFYLIDDYNDFVFDESLGMTCSGDIFAKKYL